MFKLEQVYVECDNDDDSYDSDCDYQLPSPPDPQIYITVTGDDQEETIALPPSLQEIFKPVSDRKKFKAFKYKGIKALEDKNIQAQRVVLNFGLREYIDLNDDYGLISHLWSAGCLKIDISTSGFEDSDGEYDEYGASRRSNGQIIGLLESKPKDIFTCAELIISMEHMTFWMKDFTFLRAYCQKLVFEGGTRNPIAAKFVEYLNNDLPVGITPKWDSHTVCMQVSKAYEDFVNSLKKRFRQAHRPLNYKLIMVMTYKRKYNAANFLVTNPITKERLELKQTIHHISDKYCQQLFDDQTKNLAQEIPFDNIPEGYALLAQIERRIDS